MTEDFLPFLTQLIVVSGSLAGLIVLIRQECLKYSEKIEGDLGDAWDLIYSYIWSNELKDSVKDLTDFIIKESKIIKDSEDPIGDVFSNSQNLSILKNRLGELRKSYDSYLSFNNIIRDFSDSNLNFKQKLERCLLFTLGVSIISLFGVYWFSLETHFLLLTRIFWGLLDIIILITLGYYYKVIQHYRNLEEIKSKLNMEKARYRHVIRGDS